MATVPKTPKDKPHGVIPKLVPRQTAASVARAALIATNRNVGPPQKLASRSQSMPVPAKTKSPRNNLKSESRPDLKDASDPLRRLRTEFRQLRTSETHRPTSHCTEMDKVYVKISVSDDAAETSVCDSSLVEGLAYESAEVDTPDTTHIVELEEGEHNATEPKISTNDDIDQAPQSRPNTPGSIRSSRPTTPKVASRPTTPRVISRPHTPRVASGPQTPAQPTHVTTPSRPNTPHQQLRPKTPVHSTASMPSPGSQDFQGQRFKADEDVRVSFSKTQKQFHLMKKELDMKQQAVLQVFDDLRMLRERMNREGITGAGEDGVSNEELLVMNIGNWTAEEVSQMVRDSITPAANEKVTELLHNLPDLDETAISELNGKIMDVPASFSELCLQAFTMRAELIDWIKNLLEQSEEKDGPSFAKIEQYNAQGLELCHTLRDLKDQATENVYALSQVIKQACRERSALMAIGQSLVREIACLRQDLETKYKPKSNTESESVKLLVETRKELEEERAARNAIREKANITESQLKHARMRISKMEKQLRESDASIVSLTGTVKSLEEQSRQKETQLEARARKLRESLKTGEMTSNHIAQQRDAFLAENIQLKELIEKIKKESASAEKDLSKKIKELNNELAEQKNITHKEKELKAATEKALAEIKLEVEDLKAKIVELENSRPNPDLLTEREMDLWAQLQATKDALRATEDEVTSCKREKIRFLETLTKLGETDNKVGIQQKLAAELQSKEEIMGQMQIQIREMTKTIKLNDQKLQQYEQYVHSLQEHNQAVLNGCEDGQDIARFENLQQEIMSLKMNLLESVNRNEELSEMLNQKEQQLNQHEKTTQAQAIVIKVREELISMLQKKETEQNQELSALQQDLEHRLKIVDEVNKQIATKAQDIQELSSSLENKQQQIYRLEKIVLALEEQHRRAQVQRTRHEEKISALEHQIASGCGRREKKFAFFWKQHLSENL